jgi:putative ABC transport system permease protein
LQDFAYRTNIGVSVFLITAAAICGVVFLTISYQSIKTAIANPIKSLRTE